MRTKVEDPSALVINTCGANDTAERGDYTSWVWSNPTNRAISHILPADPTIVAVSTECMWQSTKIFTIGGFPNPAGLAGNWRLGKAKKPLGAWDGLNRPLISDPGIARRKIYLPCFKAQIEFWLNDPIVARWVEQARNHPGNVLLRDFDTGRGIDRRGPVSHAWILATWLNTGEWPK